MQQERHPQFRGPVARDFGFSEMPKSSSAESGFGRGYTIGCIASIVAIAASFFSMYLAADNDLVCLGRAGYVLISGGASFMFAVVYTIVTGKGIPWVASGFGQAQSGVFSRDKSPFAFWIVCAIMLGLCALLIGGGVWIRMEAANVLPVVRHLNRA